MLSLNQTPIFGAARDRFLVETQTFKITNNTHWFNKKHPQYAPVR